MINTANTGRRWATASGALILAVPLGGCPGRGLERTGRAQAPRIARQPAAQTSTAGKRSTFSVVATGTPPFSYEWRRNGASLHAVSTAEYTTAVLTGADDGAVYTVVVSNAAGSVVSLPARLRVVGRATSALHEVGATPDFRRRWET